MPLPEKLNDMLSPNTLLEAGELCCLPENWMNAFEACNNEVCFRVSGVPEILHRYGLYTEFESIPRKRGPRKEGLLSKARANIPAGWMEGELSTLGTLIMSEGEGFDIKQLHKARRRRPMRFDKACMAISILDVFLKESGENVNLYDEGVRILPTLFRVPSFDIKVYSCHIKGWDNRKVRASFRKSIGQSQGKFFNFVGNSFLKKASSGGCYSYATAKGIYRGLSEGLNVDVAQPEIICESLEKGHVTVRCEATP